MSIFFVIICDLICLHVKVMVSVVCQIIFLYHCVTLFVYMQRKKKECQIFFYKII
jgi:hypothetical protein